jgi:DNA processing protein
MPRATEILSDQELKQLTQSFQLDEYSKDRAIELVAAMVSTMVTEPGDRMAGSLRRVLGQELLVELLIEGFEPRHVLELIREANASYELEALFGNLEQTITESRQRWLPRLSKTGLEKNFENSRALGLKLLTPDDANWPRGLNDLQDSAPAMLFVEGSVNLLVKLENAVSIVGSRDASGYGLTATEKIVAELAKVSRPTVSGGAIGIDARAHFASIKRALPTVAVMAGGLDRKYPRANFPLFDQIRNSGTIISELAPGIAPSRWRFLQRNRLIAALSPTTIVVEAGIRSGSIRTANNALELERELIAVPGSMLSAVSQGTNSLIAEGKAIALASFVMLSGNEQPQAYAEASYLAKRTHDAISDAGRITKIDIARLAGLTEFELKLALTELEKANQLSVHPDSKGVLHYALKYASKA